MKKIKYSLIVIAVVVVLSVFMFLRGHETQAAKTTSNNSAQQPVIEKKGTVLHLTGLHVTPHFTHN